MVVVAAAQQEVRGSRQSPSGCTVHRTVKEGWGAALLSRPLDHASLHARAGVRGTGCRRGGGERRACAAAAAASYAGNSGRPEATAELAPTNCGLLAHRRHGRRRHDADDDNRPRPGLDAPPRSPAAVPAGAPAPTQRSNLAAAQNGPSFSITTHWNLLKLQQALLTVSMRAAVPVRSVASASSGRYSRRGVKCEKAQRAAPARPARPPNLCGQSRRHARRPRSRRGTGDPHRSRRRPFKAAPAPPSTTRHNALYR